MRYICKLFLALPAIFFIVSCAQTQPLVKEIPSGDLSIFFEKSLCDIIENRLPLSDAVFTVRNFTGERNNRWLQYSIISDVYIRRGSGLREHFIFDGNGNEIRAPFSVELDTRYRLGQNSDFNPNKQYRVYFTLSVSYPDRNRFIAHLHYLKAY